MFDLWAQQPHEHPGERPRDASDFARGFHDFNQLALWTAATLAGMVTAMLVARTPFFRRVIARLYPSRPAEGKRPSRAESLPMLADAVIGTPRDTILAVFGPPRAAIIQGSTEPAGISFWDANTWYYPLPRNGKLAMAIGFEDDTAREVDFFTAPGLSDSRAK